MKESGRCSTGRQPPTRRAASAADCVDAFRRLRVDRELAAVQDEIDQLQERSEITDGALAALWERKKELLRRLEELN